MEVSEKDLDSLERSADAAARLLKALSNKDRLMILCYLAEGERKVGDLEALLDLRQPTLSQQLARLRNEGLVATRRSGKSIYYSLASVEVQAVIETLYRLYCAPEQAGKTAGAASTPETAPVAQER
ncbi:ArsR/SmtB family transcription factor [Rhodovibrio salinarum]|uniref:Transcriptional regulator n=1 Tax=Rhodovibrio salinarum TaxID=1087 RepID=A0A934UZR9_9PROT|nr:metalloregulator ArsR/SmtB family transcription factor [Rhodovibrio salinarum]MBK1697482.1 transcriptional regulator [Rhodovibrio salinarum]